MGLVNAVIEAYRGLPKGKVSDVPHNAFHVGAGLTIGLVDAISTAGVVTEPSEDVKKLYSHHRTTKYGVIGDVLATGAVIAGIVLAGNAVATTVDMSLRLRDAAESAPRIEYFQDGKPYLTIINPSEESVKRFEDEHPERFAP